MRCFYFHLVEPSDVTLDQEGVHLADEAAALAFARAQVRGMLAQEVRESGELRLDRAIEIATAEGVCRRMKFVEAVSIGLGA